MSQWNNSYNYNNQYQGANTWNGDVNGQYANHSYYPNSSNQYVSFNEFVSQIQGNNVAQNTANYNNVQYQNYPASQQYNYQDPPSSSQNAQVESYNYGTSSTSVNNEQTYQAQTQYKPPLPEPSSYTADMVKKSNLTATATEFVPKNKNTAKPKEQDTQAEPPAHKNGRDSKNIHSSSSDKNWRERRQPQTQDSGNRYNNRQNDSSRGESSSNYKNYDSSSYNRENNSKNRNRDYNNRKNGSRNEEGTHSESSNNYGNYSRQNESSSHNERNRRNDKQYNRNDDQSGYHEYSNSGNEANSRRYDNDRGPSRSKTKNKDIDRTFYNSSINKSSQDVRGGRGEGSRKNWSGRVRGGDRPTVEDEQYASNYLQYRDEKEKLNRAESAPSPRRNKSNQSGDQKGDKELTQRERLSEQLDKGTLECLVCCERVKQIDMVWSCANCYHVLHLKCIKKWAVSSVVEGKWRCPACQNTSSEIPSEYRCMCGSVRAPEYHRGDVGAHTCGDSCRRQRPCGHPCPLLCHPGPCPPCQTVLHKPCGCGAEMRRVVCSDKTGQICGRICDKELSCTAHRCNKECHEGPCDDCEHTVTQICYCMEQKPRTVPCTRDSSSCASYCCGGACLRVLACGAHSCARDCHPPPCEECELLPENLTTCPCGKTKLDPSSRKTCSDPIPLCGNICAKPLQCGPAGDKHFCKMSCHEGDCPACDEKTLLQCRCGHSSREVPCADLPDMLNNVFCQRKCNKKLSCDRHRCRSVCCALTVHRCGAVCGRSLPCQLHRCQDLCHTGHCAPCPNISFSELTCACGAEVLYPPIRCGTKPPRCSAPCRRARACGHPPHHACHAGDCPPCVVLTTKSCHGRHEERKTIPCSQEEFSCGLPCGKPLPCGKHTCIKTCHKGPCDTAKCVQPCQELRARCGHPCAAACHPRGERCPSAAPCRRPVRATCPCGRRHADRSCADNARDLARIMSALAATKMQEEGSVDLSESQRPAAMLKTLECDDECRVEARTRQLALALQIRNPDVSAKLAPRYSDHVRTTALKEPAFAQQVHDQLSELVQRAKKSKQKTRSHSFPSMNWQKRQFIHELCEHFGCESVAYDAEPNRNVVATADKEKSWLPAMSVMEVLSREAGKRRVPGPILRAPPAPPAQGANKSSGGWATLTSTNAWAARSQAKSAPAATASATTSATATVTATTSATTPAEKIDYFDNPPDN